ncbi:4173_t:CDS:1 [Racocetra persica]|uniref:4173_t:CDS:1 n=1 Tax=Racocetra persica TaxID=160502 RepID=A0ACA9P2I3_9GLOM|nr:4173_t:CDS:1 [Racocetra persica]
MNCDKVLDATMFMELKNETEDLFMLEEIGNNKISVESVLSDSLIQPLDRDSVDSKLVENI